MSELRDNARDLLDKYRQLPKAGRWAILGISGLLAIGVLAAIFGESTEPDPAGEKSEQPAPANTSTTRPESPDTGRMSGEEFSSFNRADDEFRGEVEDFADGLGGKCAALAGNLELAAFSECVSDAYDGIDGQAALTADEFKGLQGDTAKTCRSALKKQSAALDDLYANVRVVGKLAEDLALTGDLADAAARELRSARRTYDRRDRRSESVCAPK